MRPRRRSQVRGGDVSPYATREDFIGIFHEHRNDLYQLAFLLTADHEKAEKCVVAGIEDCVKENRVFREWARSWAKRIIVENAIRELKPRPGFGSSSRAAAVFSHSPESIGQGEHFDVEAILRLGDFERVVFVMSVLEHYSHHECALLLGCSVLEIRQGYFHGLEQMTGSNQTVSYA